MEGLRSSLNKDDPDRTILSLRLADLYFDTSIQEGAGEDLIYKRKMALKLYQDVLQGRDHLEIPKPKNAIVLKFQIARVLTKLGQHSLAESYYRDVFYSKLSLKKMKREAAFSLAEYFEEKFLFKKSDKFYLAAISLCENVSSCNYAHYKRAWLHYKEVKIDTAISELKMALFEENGQVREKVLNDLFLFFSARQTDGVQELSYIEDLEKKLKRRDLVKKLVEAFYSAGNRIAGTTTLVVLYKRESDVFYEARLLEEFYGHKNLNQIDNYLGFLEKRSPLDLPKNDKEKKEFKSMLKRTMVQFDSEAQSSLEFSAPLKRLIDLFLLFYPKDKMRVKLQQGWLKIEQNFERRLARLGKWIKEDIRLQLPKEHIRKLRQTRLSLAQKLKKTDVELEEALALGNLLQGEAESREFYYVAAYRLYNDKNYKRAKKLLEQLASIDLGYDKWALNSQRLLLDIYHQEKNYLALINQADTWLNYPTFKNNKKRVKEFKEIEGLKRQADFEYAVKLGVTDMALKKFYQFCLGKIFEKRSCENARILAIKLKDQSKLIALLEKAKDEKSLRYEYEAVGEFIKAARLQEKHDLKHRAKTTNYLKVALLYELGIDHKSRDRVLYQLVAKIKKEKAFEKGMEVAVYSTLEQAELLNNKTLFLPWSTSRKLSLANRLNLLNPNQVTRKFVTKQTKYIGSTWARHVLTMARSKFKQQEKLKFYGRYSQSKFKKRIKGLQKASQYAKSYLEGADLQTRIYLLDMLTKSYQTLGEEIIKTPVPEGLTEEVLRQVKSTIQKMAIPYLKVAKDYSRLLEDELMGIVDMDLRKNYQEQLGGKDLNYARFIRSEDFVQQRISVEVYKAIHQKMKVLKENPYDSKALKRIEDYLIKNNQLRLASYFKGRRLSFKE